MKIKLTPLFFILAITLFCVCALATRGYSGPRGTDSEIHFFPNSQEFWDFSKNWTTNYGPAYRDTALGASSFLPCTGQYALCFHSGPKPLPCELTNDGRFANCECTVQTGRNFVLMTGILNAKVYQDTVNVCGPDGSDCTAQPDKAPVCRAIAQGKLIPGADVISTYSPHDESDLTKLLTQAPGKPILTICPKAPYAGCMTAPCKITKSGHAECSCPVFWGIFQLTGAGAQCTLGDDLVNSASYAPARDVLP
ncbi:MAG: hypothetical protein ACREDM_12400 [Methylocella sp.]